MSRGPILVDLDADRMRSLLDQLDGRLRQRGVKASVYLVGGAAMTLGYGRERLTPDIDAVISHQAVLEELGSLPSSMVCRRTGSTTMLAVGSRRAPSGRIDVPPN